MVIAAKERVAQLKELGFKDAEVYGDKELGGLHTIVVAHRGLEAHGLKRDPKIGVTNFWQLLKPLGGLGIAATAVGLGFSYFMARDYKRGEYTYDEANDTVNVKEVE
jgi:formate dehydrogenase iron-sulfur subunit